MVPEVIRMNINWSAIAVNAKKKDPNMVQQLELLSTTNGYGKVAYI
jgi:hypothetical protein